MEGRLRHRGLAEGPDAAGRPRRGLHQPEGPAGRREPAGKNDRLAKVYFDYADQLKANPTGYFPYTPPLPLLYGLREALACLFEEGLENVYHRHHVLGEATRQAVAAWGLKTCAKEPKWNSDTVTAIVVPEGVDAAKIIKHAYVATTSPSAQACRKWPARCSASAMSAT